MIDITPDTRIIDLTVGQLMEVIESASLRNQEESKRVVHGIAGIAQIFNCSISTAQRIKASGKIDAAISQCGRTMVIDVEKAIRLFKANK